jgi:AcrR family transcriptional regulator
MDITKEKILCSATQLFFRIGIKSITMDDVARDMGISKKTLYIYVDNKKDLLRQVIELHSEKEIEASELIHKKAENAVDEVLGYAIYGIEMIKQFSQTVLYDLQKFYPDLWALVDQLQNKHYYAAHKINIERGIREGLYRSDIHPEVIAKLFVFKSLCIVDENIFPAKSYSSISLLREHVMYHLRGICTPKGLEVFQTYINTLEDWSDSSHITKAWLNLVPTKTF